MSKYNPEDLQVHAEYLQNDDRWIAAAFIEEGDKRTVIAISHGLNEEQAISEAMHKALGRIDE